MQFIDINCDLGEGMPCDHAIAPYISSASIACGGHYGSAETMAHAIETCIEYGVATGAHPAYPDPQNFGRVSMDINIAQLMAALKRQIDFFEAQCMVYRIPMHHIKLHGALYHDMANNEKMIFPFLALMQTHYPTQLVYGLAGSRFTKILKENGINVAAEAFADRAYNYDGSLLSRSIQGAVHSDHHIVTDQVLQLVLQKKIKPKNGPEMPLAADTICIHSDTPEAVVFAKTIYEKLTENRIGLKAVNP